MLLCLGYEAAAAIADALANFLRLMPDDNRDSLYRDAALRCVEDMFDEGLPTGLVQNLCLAALHSGAQPSGEYDCAQGCIVLHVNYFDYGVRHSRAWVANSIATQAMAAESCRIFSPLASKGRDTTSTPNSAMRGVSCSTGKTLSAAYRRR